MRLRLLPFLVIALFPLSAQESQDSVIRTCRAYYLGGTKDSTKEIYLFDGLTSQKVLLSSMNFSQVIELAKGDIQLTFSRKALTESDALKKTATSLVVGKGITDFFLLVEDDPDNTELALKVQVVDLTGISLEDGETLWINRTDHKISAVLGENSVVIQPNEHLISPPPLEKSGYYKAQFNYMRDNEGQFLPVMRKSWWFDSTSKNLGFIVDTGARMPKIFAIRDSRVPAATTKP